MSLSPERGQPGVLVGGERGPLPQIAKGTASRHALDGLVESAFALLLAGPRVIARRGAEAEMDYLATREEFMLLLESNVESGLGRASTGAEDAPFEGALVELMTAVQSRLESSVSLTAKS